MKPNKLELSSVDGTQLNLEALYQIAPSMGHRTKCITMIG